MFDSVEPINNACDKQTTNTGDAFDDWFADLLEVPWDEYLAHDDDVETIDPPHAQDSSSYHHTDAIETEECDPEIVNERPLSIDESLNYIHKIRDMC